MLNIPAAPSSTSRGVRCRGGSGGGGETRSPLSPPAPPVPLPGLAGHGVGSALSTPGHTDRHRDREVPSGEGTQRQVQEREGARGLGSGTVPPGDRGVREWPPGSHQSSDLRLVLSTGQGEIARPLRRKTGLAVCLSGSPSTPLHLCGPCRPRLSCDPVCRFLLPLSVWLALGGVGDSGQG